MPAQNLPGLVLDRAHPLSRGLVGWWPMNEGGGTRVNDISGIGNHGTLTNVSPGPTSGWSGGRTGSAIRFDGSDDYITIPHSPTLALVGDMSISLWMFFTIDAAYKMLVSKDATNVPKPYDYYVREVGADGLPLFLRGNGSSNASVAGATAPASNIWNHLAVTMLGTTVTHYLNGRPSGSGTLSTTIADGGDPLRIGTRADGFTGACAVASPRIYNRALSAVEVAQLYADPMAGAIMPSNPRRYYFTAPVAPPPTVAPPLSSDRLYNRSQARIFRRGETG